MSAREHLHDVVATLQPVLQGVPPGDLDGPTPCDGWTLRDLVGHVLGTTDAMRRVGAHEPLDREDPWGSRGHEVGATWRDDLGDRLIALADAWSRPEAWEGEALDGSMTREEVGRLAYVEVMVHGWDLARATGQEVTYSEAAVAEAEAVVEQVGETGRSMGAFGEEVRVDDDAPAFARVLGATGRDPGWSAR